MGFCTYNLNNLQLKGEKEKYTHMEMNTDVFIFVNTNERKERLFKLI